LSFLIVFSSHTTAISGFNNYQEELSIEKEKLTNFVAYFRSIINEFGNPRLMNLDNRVDFRIVDLPIPNAWAGYSRTTRRPTIYMTPTLRLLITYLADADVISFLYPDFLFCRGTYVNSLFKNLADNRKRMSEGLSPYNIPAPEIFLSGSSPPCRDYKDMFPIDPQYRQSRDHVGNIVVGLIYLHELGHIALGHSAIWPSSCK
jgi:hypothetical protein